MMVVPLILLCVAAIHDLRSRTIPDWIAVALLIWSVAITAWGVSGISWSGLVGGALLGFVLAAGVFWLGGIGGGDVKLVAALGACLGPAALLGVLFWMAIAGGLLALIAKLRGRHDLAYVPAIAAGLLVYAIRAGGWPHVQ